MLLSSLVLIPFLGSVLAALMPQDARNRESWLAIAVAGCGLIAAGSLFPQIAAGEVLREEFAWLPAKGLSFVLRIDGLAWVFTMLVLAIGLLVVLYARYYMSPQDPVPRFFSFLLAFMGSMLGVVLSGNLVQLVVFWELTSLTSFLLIGYWHHRADARRGARMAFTVTATGGLCLMAGVLVIGHIVGSYDLDVVLAAGDLIRGQIHRVLNLPNESGLSEYLEDPLATVPLHRPFPDLPLQVATAGNAGLGGANTLRVERLLAFIQDASARYDVVIVDTPPTLPVPYSRIVASCAGHTVLIVSWGRTDRQVVRHAAARLASAEAHLSIAVLNRVNLDRQADFDCTEAHYVRDKAYRAYLES